MGVTLRVFVTGATGYIGSAIVQELLGDGHKVVGLARTDAAASALDRVGAEHHRGALDDLEALRGGAAASDGVVHTAFIHDFVDFAAAARTDAAAVRAMGQALAGSGRPLVVASGIAGLLADGLVGTEADPPAPDAGPRKATEEAVAALADQGVRSVAVRLPPTVHGPDDAGFLPAVIAVARAGGVSSFVGDGDNRWPAVHRLDAAHLFCLALESAPAGTVLHATAEDGVPFLAIAQAIGIGLSVPTASVTADDAMQRFGFLGSVVGLDMVATSHTTRSALGWDPTRPGVLADLGAGFYFGEG